MLSFELSSTSLEGRHAFLASLKVFHASLRVCFQSPRASFTAFLNDFHASRTADFTSEGVDLLYALSSALLRALYAESIAALKVSHPALIADSRVATAVFKHEMVDALVVFEVLELPLSACAGTAEKRNASIRARVVTDFIDRDYRIILLYTQPMASIPTR